MNETSAKIDLIKTSESNGTKAADIMVNIGGVEVTVNVSVDAAAASTP